MPRLLLLLTGGTLLMTPGDPASSNANKRGAVTLDEERTSRDLIIEVPSLGRIADFDTRLLFHMDSANMQPADWLTLARVVHEELPRYDGIVVVHGTDTMAYTASALSMLLGRLPKPVVLTGAQKPLVEIRTDARQNLIDAAMVATLGVPEVSIVNSARALRGARSTKRDAWGFAAFDSPNCAPLVELGIGVEIGPHVLPPAPLAPFDERLERRVLALRVFPGLDPELVRAAIRSGVRGLVLEAYGTGNLPNLGGSLIPALVEAREHNVPVVVVSQCLRGFVELGQYDGGAAAQDAGAISGGDMTVEAALAKLMVGLGRFGPGEELRHFLAASVVGERDA
ncbi:L-asparaginase I, cytoplasmic [Labilithrix luteola]|uniref:asparaginase n=1 Tax=Labilithrix luteola TaxID=1391654 RepID=A0A0K1Q7W3_9BACT|nr:asparaginase [Labilithrix luteola]AKV01737.1 L-asparaginase I, cytoplasmic [Labilithrix luteola]